MKLIKLCAAAAAPLLLSGCLLLPGKFNAEMTLAKNGTYDFRYTGQIQIISGDKNDGPPVLTAYDPKTAYCEEEYDPSTKKATPIPDDGWKTQEDQAGIAVNPYNDTAAAEAASEAAEAAAEAAQAAADAVDAAGSDSGFGAYEIRERKCTKAELAAREVAHKEDFERKKSDYEQKMKTMGTMFGGAIPGNDAELKKFAAELAKYDGWKKVEYVGKDMFEVDFQISGATNGYFAFPVLPEASVQYPFFQLVRRANGAVDVITPMFGGSTSMMSGLMFGMMRDQGGNEDKGAEFGKIDGTFTLKTDGEILGNNAVDGYQLIDGWKVMNWTVGSSQAPPRALVSLK